MVISEEKIFLTDSLEAGSELGTRSAKDRAILNQGVDSLL